MWPLFLTLTEPSLHSTRYDSVTQNSGTLEKVFRQKAALEMRAGSHRVLATRCLPLCTAGFSFWLLQKTIFCVQIFFFFTKLTPFPLEEHWFLPVCCSRVKPNQHVGPISLSVNASRLLGTAFLRSTPFSEPAGRQQKDLWDFVAFRIQTARQNHGLFIYFLSYSSDWSCQEIKTHSQFKPTHILPLNAPICFKRLFPPVTSAVPVYKQKTIGNN